MSSPAIDEISAPPVAASRSRGSDRASRCPVPLTMPKLRMRASTATASPSPTAGCGQLRPMPSALSASSSRITSLHSISTGEGSRRGASRCWHRGVVYAVTSTRMFFSHVDWNDPTRSWCQCEEGGQGDTLALLPAPTTPGTSRRLGARVV